MKNINELFHLNNKWYDYPVNGGTHRKYKINNPKPFRVYHENGEYSLAYSYGEYKYTFSLEELNSIREQNKKERQNASERAKLIKQIQTLDTNVLREIAIKYAT